MRAHVPCKKKHIPHSELRTGLLNLLCRAGNFGKIKFVCMRATRKSIQRMKNK
jgi:hypothetical protein